jgi:hypothetical protein
MPLKVIDCRDSFAGAPMADEFGPPLSPGMEWNESGAGFID